MILSLELALKSYEIVHKLRQSLFVNFVSFSSPGQMSADVKCEQSIYFRALSLSFMSFRIL